MGDGMKVPEGPAGAAGGGGASAGAGPAADAGAAGAAGAGAAGVASKSTPFRSLILKPSRSMWKSDRSLRFINSIICLISLRSKAASLVG